MKEELVKICGGEVTCYFDNVGGKTSELVIENMEQNANIVLCGQISSYNNRDIPYPNPLPEHLNKVTLPYLPFCIHSLRVF